MMSSVHSTTASVQVRLAHVARRYLASVRARAGLSRSLVGTAALSLLGAMGCSGYAITATDGRVFASSDDPRSQLGAALTASGARDLSCSKQLDVRRLDAERQYLVSGCGFHAVYAVDTPTVATRRLELMSRAPDGSETAERAALAAADEHSSRRAATGSAGPPSASNRPQL
jgi:hypothetical protein